MLPRARPPAPPKHLSPRCRAIWRQLLGEWSFEPHELIVLRLLLESVDRAEQARQGLKKDGLLIDGRYGKKLNPLAAVERDATLRAVRLLRALKFEHEQPAALGELLSLPRRRANG